MISKKGRKRSSSIEKEEKGEKEKAETKDPASPSIKNVVIKVTLLYLCSRVSSIVSGHKVA